MTKGKRKKRTWIIAGVACLIVVGLIISAMLLLNSEKEKRKLKKYQPVAEAISLEDVILGKLNPKPFNATWITGSELLYTDVYKNLIKYNVETKNRTVLLESTDEIMPSAYDYQVSSDKKFLMVAHDFQKIYRHSYRCRVTLIDLTNGGRTELKLGPNLDMQLVIWSPVGNALAFVFDNNIYYKSAANVGEPIQITRTIGVVSNGIPDWVYEEEVFSSNTAMWFSPDGKKIAFGRFNDTKVPVMVLPIYGEPGSLIFQYPRANFVRYPKAGTPNPEVSLHVVDVTEPNIEKQLEPPTDLINKEPILSAVEWATDDIVSAIWLNRVQNQGSIVTYLVKEPFTTEIVKNLHETSGWLELFTAPKFSESGSKLALILSQDQGKELGAYRHLVLLSKTQNSEAVALTKGPYVVEKILGWNYQDNLIYYLANKVNESESRHLYSVSPETKQIKCLSCGVLSKNLKTECTYNSAEFSKDFSYYMLSCEGPDVPVISIYAKDNKKVLEWNENKDLIEFVHKKEIPITKKMTFEIADGFTARVMLKLPPNMDTSGNTKYPMLINVYGGPDYSQVVDSFGLDWGSYLATNKGIIYGLIDGRGSGLRGDKLLFSGYRHLGSVEVVDQINVTRLIQKSLPYVDATRTAIWGWSYGGYASGMALAQDTEGVFKCGISVAPVTDWTLYDSIYTERFMGLPTLEDNLKGYYESQLLTKFEGLRNKQYYLIHGTYDDNVHYQQSMLWSKVLEQNDILFRQQSYPDEDHSLASVRPHFYHSLENFLDECFLDQDD